jgi:hypothetical protein
MCIGGGRGRRDWNRGGGGGGGQKHPPPPPPPPTTSISGPPSLGRLCIKSAIKWIIKPLPGPLKIDPMHMYVLYARKFHLYFTAFGVTFLDYAISSFGGIKWQFFLRPKSRRRRRHRIPSSHRRKIYIYGPNLKDISPTCIERSCWGTFHFYVRQFNLVEYLATKE